MTTHFLHEGNEIVTERTLNYEEESQYGWKSDTPNQYGLITDHQFIVEPISDNQCRFIQTDDFKAAAENAPAHMIA